MASEKQTQEDEETHVGEDKHTHTHKQRRQTVSPLRSAEPCWKQH